MSNKFSRNVLLNSVFIFLGLIVNAQVQTTSGTTGSAVQVTIPTSISQDGFTGSVPAGTLNPQPLEISFLDAIDRGLRQNLGLGAADVGPPPKELGGQSDRDLGRDQRDRFGSAQLCQQSAGQRPWRTSRRFAEQHGKLMDRVSNRCFQRRYG